MMDVVFVSFGFRFRVNVEAMNMVESVGNYSRHRVAPIIRRIEEDGKVRYGVLPRDSHEGIDLILVRH